ncbi:hypothetical protein Tco_1578427 [Tanacetum coccineum]
MSFVWGGNLETGGNVPERIHVFVICFIVLYTPKDSTLPISWQNEWSRLLKKRVHDSSYGPWLNLERENPEEFWALKSSLFTYSFFRLRSTILSSPIKEKLRNLEERYIHEGRVVFDNFTDLNYVRSLFHFVEFECLLEINEQVYPRFILEFYSQYRLSYSDEEYLVRVRVSLVTDGHLISWYMVPLRKAHIQPTLDDKKYEVRATLLALDDHSILSS